MLFALRRLLVTVPLLVVVSLLVFLIGSLLPGDPAAARFDMHGRADERQKWRIDHGFDDEIVCADAAAYEDAAARGFKVFRFDAATSRRVEIEPDAARALAAVHPEELRIEVPVPLLVRYVRYMGGVVTRFDFGTSYTDERRIGPELLDKFSATIELALFAMAIAIPVGVGVGVLGAVRRGRFLDYLANVLALFGNSIPVFWLGMVLLLAAISLGFRHFNARYDVMNYEDVIAGYSTKFYLLESLVRGQGRVAWSCVQYLLVPALALSTIPMAVITRMTRASVLEEIGKDYVQTARAKGLRPSRVVMRHVLRNAMVQIVTVMGLQTGALLSGAVLTETVFNWKGLGTFILDGVRRNDSPVLVGGILLVATTFIVVNLVVDLLYGVIDPRIRVSG